MHCYAQKWLPETFWVDAMHRHMQCQQIGKEVKVKVKKANVNFFLVETAHFILQFSVSIFIQARI